MQMIMNINTKNEEEDDGDAYAYDKQEDDAAAGDLSHLLTFSSTLRLTSEGSTNSSNKGAWKASSDAPAIQLPLFWKNHDI